MRLEECWEREEKAREENNGRLPESYASKGVGEDEETVSVGQEEGLGQEIRGGQAEAGEGMADEELEVMEVPVQEVIDEQSPLSLTLYAPSQFKVEVDKLFEPPHCTRPISKAQVENLRVMF